MTRRQRARENGQITLVTVGFFAVVGLLAVVVINASDAFLERQRLNGLADGAVVAAADALDLDAFYSTGLTVIDPDAARASVVEHVSGTPDVRVVEVRLDGDTVTVRLERDVSLPLTPPGLTPVTTIVAEASGQLRRTEPA